MEAQGTGSLKQLESLAQGLLEARRLSQPQIDAAGSGDGYSRLLRKNRRRLAQVAERNRELLDGLLYPLLGAERLLTEEEIAALEGLSAKLLQSWPEEDLDLSLLVQITRRLLSDAVAQGEDDRIVLQCGRHISACYSNLNRVNRIRTSRELVERYQKEGLHTAERLLRYLEHKAFAGLKTAEARRAVLSNARFYLALYDTWYTTDEETNELRLQGLLRANALAEDPWYIEHAPEYDWRQHRLRTYEHMGQLTENGNQWGMTRTQCRRIMEHMDELALLWHEDEVSGEELLPRVHLELILERNAYYAERIGREEYRERLLAIYTKYANAEYDMYSVLANLFVSAEYLSTVSVEDADEHTLEILRGLYRWVTSYVLNSRGSDAYSFMLEYLSAFLERFVEIPGEYEFSRMALQCLAALDPPSYVHSLQVAALSRCLCGHLLRVSPESLIGAEGCRSVEEVTERGEELVRKCYEAGLCHDLGKLPMIDTVIQHGRELIEAEKDILHQHPSMGGYLLARHASTRGYAGIAESHHCWYDGTRGYPTERRYADTPSVLAWIVALAAAMDTASDEPGRGEREQRSLEELFSELGAGAGTRYAPEIVALLRLPEVWEDIRFLLEQGSEDSYRNTYLLLRDVQTAKARDLDSRLESFVVRTERIRELSAPQLDEIGNPAEYGVLLKQHFQEIGMLAEENKKLLERTVYPMLDREGALSAGEAASLQRFCDELLSGQNLSDLDQSLVYRLSARLLRDARERGETAALIHCLDVHISSCYEMMHQTKRMETAGALTVEYREEGLGAAREIWEYIEPERFAALDEKSRELVLINMRYAVYMLETDSESPGVNEEFIGRLERAYRLADEPCYREMAPDYDWNYHRIRCLEYTLQATECGNRRGFSPALCERIADAAERLVQIWESAPETNAEILSWTSVRLHHARALYFAGRIGREEYRDRLRDIYRNGRGMRYDFDSVFPNLSAPLELIISYEEQGEYSAEEEREITEIYTYVIRYVFHATNGEAFSLLMEYFSDLLYHFIELPTGMSFQQMGLYSMAALHPPTYVHSRMVAELSRCLCRQLLRRRPELFAALPEYEERLSAQEREERIAQLCYDAALCHDFGKLPMIDTIFVYGRRLLDAEYALLQHHPRVGAILLGRYGSTRRYAEVALGHHRWHDGSGGYPKEYEVVRSADRILIDIVTVADCMDAATDTVGRSYTGGKRPADIIAEIQAQAGSRYSAEIAAILTESEVYAELCRLLDEGRRENYSKTYDLLTGILQQGQDEDAQLRDNLTRLYELLTEEERLGQAYKLTSYDQQTSCPPAGQEDAGEVMTALSGAMYRIRKSEEYTQAVERLYQSRALLDEWDSVLAEQLYRRQQRESAISPAQQERYDAADHRAFTAWMRAREANDFALFEGALRERCVLAAERVGQWAPEAAPQARTAYDRLLDEHERGMTTERLDALFASCGERIRRLLEPAARRSRKLRTDFLSRRVEDAQQARAAEYLLELMGFDRTRGTWGISTHPFTERIGRHDTRVTTHYEPESFLSSIYTVIHECGHALFEQLQPEENDIHHIADYKTMGQHESVSRFYENIIGRSEAFLRLIYPALRDIFPQVLSDVSEVELSAAVNLVTPSLIRTEADELTYTLHIIIRYELEREMIDGGLEIHTLPAVWAEKYRHYLGIAPEDDLHGVLQDIHWTDSFGYFPTYALGNFYGGMYLKRMQEDFDPFASLGECGFTRINDWMREHVFARADRLAPAVWIREITGRELTAEDYVEYLEKKYGTPS